MPTAFIQALTASLLPPDGPAGREVLHGRVAVFIAEQLAMLPLPLRAGFALGMFGFRLFVLLSFGRGFCSLAPERRREVVDRWSFGSFRLARQLFRPVRSLALLSYFELLSDEFSELPAPAPRPAGPLEGPLQVLVIGSGAGGAVTALELASRGYQVTVLEEGAPSEGAAIDPGSTETMKRLYRQRGMTPLLGRVPIAYVEGCCVGGSTEINSGFWHRTPPEIALRWKAQYGLADARPEDLAPHTDWAERLLDVGPSKTAWPPSTQVLARGIQAMGWSAHEVPRTAAAARNGWTPGNPIPAPNHGMSRTLLPAAVAAGAQVVSGCRVERLLIEGRRVTGALLERRHEDGRKETVRVTAEHVFVCAGATETPALLRRSGLTRHIGDTLRIHPMLKVAALFPEELHSSQATMPLLQVKEFWPDLVLGGAFFSPGHLAVILGDNWPETKGCMDRISRMACYYVGVRGTGHGWVRPSRIEPGRTVLRYDLSQQDLWNLGRGLARLSTLLLKAGAEAVYPAIGGLPALRDEVEAIRWLDERLDGAGCSLSTVHAFSTCPIGERIDRCAADSFGKVHDMENLYINDASMLPDSPGVNPQGTIMTLARRNVVHFSEARR